MSRVYGDSRTDIYRFYEGYISDPRHWFNKSLVTAYSLTYWTTKTERETRRFTVRQVASRVGKWMVFLSAEFPSGVYTSDDPYACCGDADIGGEFLTLNNGAV